MMAKYKSKRKVKITRKNVGIKKISVGNLFL